MFWNADSGSGRPAWPALILTILLLPAFLLSAPPTSGMDMSMEMDEADADRPRVLLPSISASARRLLADQFMIQATESFHFAFQDDQWPLERARILVEQAARLIPTDPEIWRNRLVLAQEAGDQDVVVETMERLVRLTPEDDVLRLRLIERRLQRFQTIDEQLEAIETMLASPEARLFSDALRSRIASFAARGYLETGRRSDMVRMLREATRLDTTNKDAAVMVLELVKAETRQDPARLGVALAGVIQADPLDLPARRGLADLFFEQGAYAQALAQYLVANWLMEGEPDPEKVYRFAMSLAATGDFNSAIQLVASYQNMLWQTVAPGEAGTAEAGPATARLLPLDLQLLRIVLLVQNGERDRAASFFRPFRRELENRLPAEEADVQILWIATGMDIELTDAEALRTRVQSQLGVEDPMWQRIEGFRLLNLERLSEARALLQPLVRTDLFARLAIARLLGEDTRTADSAATLLRTITQEGPRTIAGMLAAYELTQYRVQPPLGRVALHLSGIVNSWPAFFQDPSQTNLNLTQLTVTTERDGQVGYLQPITARISIRNPNSLPVSLGGGGVVNSSAMIILSARSEGRAIPPPSPIVIDLGRRLRLMPGESIEVPVRLDWTVLGGFLSHNPAAPFSYSLRVIHGPIITERGTYGADRFGQVANIFVRIRQPLPIQEMSIEAALGSLGREDEGARMLGLAILARSTAVLFDQLSSLEQQRAEATDIDIIEAIDETTDFIRTLRNRIVRSLNGRFGRLDPIEQAWVVRMMPRITYGGSGMGWLPGPATVNRYEGLEPLIEQARATRDPRVLTARILNWINNPADPELEQLTESPNPEISGLARAQAGMFRDVAARLRAEEERRR